jgi:RNA polymerase sigma-70 factor (ECF subfamily)
MKSQSRAFNPMMAFKTRAVSEAPRMAGRFLKPHFDEVVRLHWPRIFRFVLASVGDNELAADLTQDCFSNAYQAWTQFRGDSSVYTWLKQIALNVIRNFARNKRLQFLRRATPIDNISVDCLTDSLAPCPEANAIRQHVLRTIWKVAEGVSAKQQQALRLRFVHDLELFEIAAVMGITEGSVKVHLFRAVQSIRKTLQNS